ncbi:MAG: ParB/RepB/Spo0J family partition protein [Holophagales bacterium]|nr:ParB/RepB/Spo0J family partition protein [Holophagales bacterium]
MSAKRRGLGRGLDALLGSQPENSPGDPAGSGVAATGILEVEIDRLEPNRFQPRSHFDESGLDELAESIKAQGVVQPIVVTPKGKNRYTIIAGERRWRASQRVGRSRVPVVVRQIDDDQQLLEMALVENVQRADLNPVEEAEAYRALGESFELSQEEIAKRVGKGRTTITNFLRLLRLPQEVQDLLREGRLTAGQARPLLAFEDRVQQVELAEKAVDEGLTARDLEALAAAPRKQKAVPEKSEKKEHEPDVHTKEAMEQLTRNLQTKVDIQRKKRGGTVRIHFHSEEELIRIYDLLMAGDA